MLNLNFNPFPVIETERLILREVMDEDINEIFVLRSDPRVIKYIDRAPAGSLQEIVDFINMLKDALHNNKGICWAITIKGDPTLIGTVDIWRIIKEHHRAEIGYALHPGHQSKGYASEALNAILEYGFQTIKLHSMEANVNPENVASIKLLERAGFIREAYFKENYFFDGKYLDSAIYSLINMAQ